MGNLWEARILKSPIPTSLRMKYPAGTNTALRVCYRSLLHRFPQMQKINDSAYAICGFIKKTDTLQI